MRWLGSIPVVMLAALVACGDDDDVGADGDGSASGESGDDDAPEGGDDDDGPEDGPDTGGGPCQDETDCDDDDPCTVDTCEAASCMHEIQVSNECRPEIDVEFPPRAATIVGDAADPVVTVTGTVASPLGEITTFTIGGTEVEVGADGSFSHDVAVDVGGNMLVMETLDDSGNARRKVQSFLWSTGYRKPMTAPDDPVPEGLAFWLGQESIDDGDHSVPLDDLATALELALGAFDTNQFADPTTPVVNQAGYDVFLTSLELGSATLALAGIDGGLGLTASVDDIYGDLYFDCTTFACELAGGDGTGGLSISAVTLTGQLLLSAGPDHTLVATLANVNASVNPDDVEVWADNGWTDFLLSVVEVFVHDSLVADLEGALENAVQEQLGPALANGLASLALATTFEFPNLGNARKSIPVDLAADFASTDFHDGNTPPSPSPPQGGAVILRAGGYPGLVVSEYDNLGVPDRAGCGLVPQELTVARLAPLEISLADDTLNQLLYAGWRGGLLEFPLGNDEVGGGIIEDIDVTVSGMLAPTVSDCGDAGKLLVTIGDININGSVTLNGKTTTFDAYSTLVVNLAVTAGEDGVALDLGEVESVETELTANDESIQFEAQFIDLLEAQLVNGLLGQLGTTGFGQFSLPTIDLSAMLGLAPGTAVLEIHVDDVGRQNGTTVISARF